MPEMFGMPDGKTIEPAEHCICLLTDLVILKATYVGTCIQTHVLLHIPGACVRAAAGSWCNGQSSWMGS